MKFFRRLEPGENPDLEIERYLTAHDFPYAPKLAGGLQYRSCNGNRITLATLTAFVPGCKTAWEYTLDTLGRFYERVQTLPVEDCQSLPLPSASLLRLTLKELPKPVDDMIGAYLESARLLGDRTAALHLALAAESEDRNFTPEPSSPHSQRGLFQSLHNQTRQTFRFLNERLPQLPPDVKAGAQRVLELEDEILQRFRSVYQEGMDAARIRYHGDYGLNQVLYTGKDFLIIDFEGNPAIALSERRLKRSPLRDVAGMIASFPYAAQAGLLQHLQSGMLRPAQLTALATWSRFWARWTSAVFYTAYRQAAGSAVFLSSREANVQVMLDAYLLQKSIHDLGHDLTNRPDWVKIPLQGILDLMQPEKAPVNPSGEKSTSLTTRQPKPPA